MSLTNWSCKLAINLMFHVQLMNSYGQNILSLAAFKLAQLLHCCWFNEVVQLILIIDLYD